MCYPHLHLQCSFISARIDVIIRKDGINKDKKQKENRITIIHCGQNNAEWLSALSMHKADSFLASMYPLAEGLNKGSNLLIFHL